MNTFGDSLGNDSPAVRHAYARFGFGDGADFDAYSHPGASKYFGTDARGNKGYQSLAFDASVITAGTLASARLPTGNWIGSDGGTASLASTYTCTNTWANITLATTTLTANATHLVSVDGLGYVTPTGADGFVTIRLHDGTNPITNSERRIAYAAANGVSITTGALVMRVVTTSAITLNVQAQYGSNGTPSVITAQVVAGTTAGRTVINWTRVA